MSTDYTSAVSNRSATHEAHLNSMTAAEQARHKRHISPIQGVTGNTSILKDLYDSKAHVLMVGDSISNNASTNFTTIFHGALFTWRPLVWEGAYFGVQVGTYGTGQGVVIGPNPGKLADFNGDDYVEVANPGSDDYDDYDADLNGQYSTVSRAMKLDQTSTAQFVNLQIYAGIFTDDYKPGFWETRFPGSKMMLNNNGEAKMATAGTPLKIGASLFGSGTAEYLPDVETRFNVTINGNTSNGFVNYPGVPGLQTVAKNKDVWSSFIFSVSDGITGNTEATQIDGTSPGSDQYYVSLRENQSSFDAAKTRVAFYNVFAGTNSDGLTISYVGDGGWRLGGHNVDYPNGQSFQIGPNPPVNVYPWSYSDEHIKERMEAEDTTHLFIHLGANDVTSNDAATNTSETMTTKLNQVIERYRKLRPGLKFIVTTVYPLLNATGVKEDNRVAFNNAVLDLAYKADDIVALDLDDLLFGEGGGFATYQSPQLVWTNNQGLGLQDGTHMSANAASVLGINIWNRVTQAYNLASDASSEDVSSDKEYTALLASMKHIK